VNEQIRKQIADLAQTLKSLPETPYSTGALAYLNALEGVIERHEDHMVHQKTVAELEQKRVAAHEAHTRREREHMDARRRSPSPIRPEQQITIPSVTAEER
jgi:hypothetical protein